MDKVGVEPTSRGGLISRTPQCYLPIKPLVLGTPRGRHSSRAPDTDIQYGCLRSMPLANDDIRFVSDCSTPAYAASDNRLPACFQFKVSEQPYTVSSIRPGSPDEFRSRYLQCDRLALSRLSYETIAKDWLRVSNVRPKESFLI